MGEISNFYNFPPRMLIFGTHMPPAVSMHAAKFHLCLSDSFQLWFFVFGNKDLNSKPISSHKFKYMIYNFFHSILDTSGERLIILIPEIYPEKKEFFFSKLNLRNFLVSTIWTLFLIWKVGEI